MIARTAVSFDSILSRNNQLVTTCVHISLQLCNFKLENYIFSENCLKIAKTAEITFSPKTPTLWISYSQEYGLVSVFNHYCFKLFVSYHQLTVTFTENSPKCLTNFHKVPQKITPCLQPV